MASWFSGWATSPQPTAKSVSSTQSLALEGKGSFVVGELVEYYSASQGKWIPAKVLTVNPTGTYDLDCKPDVPSEKIRRIARQSLGTGGFADAAYNVGDLVEYFGATQGRWVPAKVLSVNAQGTYDLDCKQGVLPEKIRRPLGSSSLGSGVLSKASTYSSGDMVEYFSATQNKWIPAKVMSVTGKGTYNLDCKPDVQLEKIRPLTSRSGVAYQAGDVVEYFGATLGKWIPAKVLKVNTDGTYDLDCKQNVLPDKIRKPVVSGVMPPDAGAGPASAPLYKAGDLVAYFSASQGKWIPAKVLSVNPNGTYDLDCKPAVPQDKIRPPSELGIKTGQFGSGPLVSGGRLSGSDPSGASYALGDVVEYFGASLQRWIPAKVISVNADGTYGLDCKPDVPPARIRRPSAAVGSTGSLANSVGSGNVRRAPSFGGATLFSATADTKPWGSDTLGTVPLAAGQDPVQLLRVQRRGARWHFEVCAEGVGMLERHGGRRIAVASICGLQGSGKSFLLNLLLERAQKGLPGFKVGTAGSSGGTEGLWLWESADDDERSPLLAFIDCEGFGQKTGDTTRDSHLMMLCALLSSVLLLNSCGDLSEDLFRSLALTCRFGDNIEERGNEAHRPVLLWVLRDFVSKLKDAHGRLITPDEYLENTLHNTSTSENDQERNHVTREVRQSFLRFFRHRNCVTLASPTTEPQLAQLGDLPFASLAPDFQSGVEQLRSQMIAACLANPKSINGQPLGCYAFVQLLRQLVAAVNDDKILNMRGAWETVQHTICGTLADELRDSATEMLRALANGQQVPGGAQLPLTDEALHVVLRDQRHSLKSRWEERSVGSEAVRKEYWQELKETLAREETLVRVQNARLADQRLMEVLRAWQKWLDEDGDGQAAPVESICGQLGGTMEKMPAAALSRASRTALQAAARRVSAARSTVEATKERHEDLERKAVAWGEQAAQQHGAAASQLEAVKLQLVNLQGQAQEAENAQAQVQDEVSSCDAALQEAKAKVQEAMNEIEAARMREHELKAHQRLALEGQTRLRSELEESQGVVAKRDAERLASERCARTAAEALAIERERLEGELEEANAEVESYRSKLEQERASLQGENQKTRAEHQQRVEDVRKQLEEERKLLRGEQEKTRAEHLRMVEEAQRQLEEERKVHSGTLSEHKGRLLDHERGAGILEGQVQALTSETATLREQLSELEGKVRDAEVTVAKQTQENERCRAAATRAAAELDDVEAEGVRRLRAQEKELEQWLADQQEEDDRAAKPKCGCSIQ